LLCDLLCKTNHFRFWRSAQSSRRCCGRIGDPALHQSVSIRG